MNLFPMNAIFPLLLAEFVFGLLYALLIHWISTKNYLQGSTAWWVVVGDAFTLFIQWLFFRESWNPWVTFLCFACTGAPMVVTYLFRHQMQVEKRIHTPRPWPTRARKVRDQAVMDITAVIVEIETAAKEERITAGLLLGLTNNLHLVKKLLTSV